MGNYFTTEHDYISAKDAALHVLEMAKAQGIIQVEWDFPDPSMMKNGGARIGKLDRLAMDIVSAVARSNVQESGDITDSFVGADIDYTPVYQDR